jgi:hypothetical protein
MTPRWAKGVCPTRCVRPLPHWAGVRQQTAKSRHCHAGEQQHTSTRWAQWTPTTVAPSRDAFLRCWPLVSGSACAPWAHHSPDYCGPHVCLPALTPTTGSLSMALAPADDASPHPSAIRRPLLQFDADGTFLVTPSAMIIVSCFITYHVISHEQSCDLMARDLIASCHKWPPLRLASGAAVAVYYAVRRRTLGPYRPPPVPTALTWQTGADAPVLSASMTLIGCRRSRRILLLVLTSGRPRYRSTDDAIQPPPQSVFALHSGFVRNNSLAKVGHFSFGLSRCHSTPVFWFVQNNATHMCHPNLATLFVIIRLGLTRPSSVSRKLHFGDSFQIRRKCLTEFHPFPPS